MPISDRDDDFPTSDELLEQARADIEADARPQRPASAPFDAEFDPIRGDAPDEPDVLPLRLRTVAPRRAAIAAGILVALMGAGVALMVALIADNPSEEFGVGDCFDVPPTGNEVTFVSCAEPHHVEVIAVFESPEGDDVEFPGDVRLTDWARRTCAPSVESLVPDPSESDDLFTFSLVPSAGSWDDGDRTVTCVVAALPLGQATLVGSLRPPPD